MLRERDCLDPFDPLFPHLWKQLWVRGKSLQKQCFLPTGAPH